MLLQFLASITTFNGISVSTASRKNHTLSIAFVELEWQRFSLPNFTNNDFFARPRIHQLTLNIAPRLDFNVVNTGGVFAGGNQKAAASLEVMKSHFTRWQHGWEQMDPSAAAVQ
jgi:hypothetical protein